MAQPKTTDTKVITNISVSVFVCVWGGVILYITLAIAACENMITNEDFPIYVKICVILTDLATNMLTPFNAK